jgi:hypothetical protein
MNKWDYCNIKTSVPWCSTEHFRDLMIWLMDNVHSNDYDIDGIDLNNYNRFVWFARKEDAVMFMLRWS